MTKREKERLNRYLDRIVEGFEEFQEDLTDDTKFWNAYRSIKKMAGEEKANNEKSLSSERLRELLLTLIHNEIEYGTYDKKGSLPWLIGAMEISKEEAIELGIDKFYRPEYFNESFAEFE